MTFTITADQTYMTDFEVWASIDFKDLADANKTVTITEMCNLIQSVSITADSQQILYLDYAKHFLSIKNQKKTDYSQGLSYKCKDFPAMYNGVYDKIGGDALNLYAGTQYNIPFSHQAARKSVMTDKQVSVFR